ncbi:hypothetical protein KEM56_000145 [Ascosphaera pollenicola]|nr:hypothetical protein KEM56_000145 [Ascosphaera pollenicola]
MYFCKPLEAAIDASNADIFVEVAKEVRLFIQQQDEETRDDEPRTWDQIAAFWDVLGGFSLARHEGSCGEAVKEVSCQRIKRLDKPISRLSSFVLEAASPASPNRMSSLTRSPPETPNDVDANSLFSAELLRAPLPHWLKPSRGSSSTSLGRKTNIPAFELRPWSDFTSQVKLLTIPLVQVGYVQGTPSSHWDADEDAINGLFRRYALKPVNLVAETLGVGHVVSGSFTMVDARDVRGRGRPDFCLVEGTKSTAVAMEEGKYPGAYNLLEVYQVDHAPSRGTPVVGRGDTQFRKLCGEVAKYFREIEVRFGFVTMYEHTVLIRGDKNSKAQLAISSTPETSRNFAPCGIAVNEISLRLFSKARDPE